MNPIIKRNVDSETLLTINDDKIRIDFVSIGEGWNGDYNPDDPKDEELIRFDVYIADNSDEKNTDYLDWSEVEDGSYCTSIPVNTPMVELEKKIRTIFNEYRDKADYILNGGSVKKLGETLSWI